MASGTTGYPGSVDVFTVPSNPESTALSSAGDGTRNLTESVGDQGAAVSALEGLSAVKTHTHAAGPDGTSILSQSSTHANADTDTSVHAIHHSLGTGAFQAAPGNHNHVYSSLLNTPYQIVTSLTRPSDPWLGLMIFEADTSFLRIWASIGGGDPAWQFCPILGIPTIQLVQNITQVIQPTGTLLWWQRILADTNAFFNSLIDQTQIVVHEAGQYAANLALQFSNTVAPDTAFLGLLVNGEMSHIQQNVSQLAAGLTPGFSQTVSVADNIILQAGDVVQAQASYTASEAIGTVHTFVDEAQSLASRIGLTFIQGL